MKTIVSLIICSSVCVFSCQQADSNSYYSSTAKVSVNDNNLELRDETLATPSKHQLTQKATQPIKIIKNATSKLLVQDVDSITQIAVKLAEQKGGYVSDMKFNQSRFSIENNITISIPAQHFENYLLSINKYAQFVDYNNISSQDVTAEYIDLENRIKVKEAVKARYESILRTKTKTISDVLNTEQKIQEIQEEIEVAKGRIKYINAKAKMSTISLTLYEQVTATNKPEVVKNSFASKSKKAMSTGWQGIQSFILLLLYLWPVLLLGILAYVFIKWRLKKMKKAKQ